MTSNVTLFKTYETEIFFAIKIIQLIILISTLLFEKQKHQYNYRIIMHSRTAQCILFEYFLSLFMRIFENCYQAEQKIGSAILMPFFHSGPDISDIHISHRRFFLIEKEISIKKRYKYLVSRHFR